MRLGKYIYAKEPEGNKTILVQTTYPYIVGIPVVLDKRNTNAKERILADIANGRTLSVKIPGYNAFMSFATTMAFQKDSITDETIFETLRDMAEFYLATKIAFQPESFSRSKED